MSATGSIDRLWGVIGAEGPGHGTNMNQQLCLQKFVLSHAISPAVQTHLYHRKVHQNTMFLAQSVRKSSKSQGLVLGITVLAATLPQSTSEPVESKCENTALLTFG